MVAIQKRIVTSANWDSGRGGHAVTGIVLHTMVGYMQPSENRFNDPNSGVSVHYGVGMDGSIRQWVDEGNTAWQAGNYSVNQTTIGIEHEDNGNYSDGVRTPQLYASSSDLVADICRRYKIPCDTNHVFLHKNVIDKSRYPGGTACPDGLDTSRIIKEAAGKLGGNVDNLTEAEYDALARRVLSLGMFLTVDGSAPDRQPTRQEVVDAINGLKSDPVAYLDYLLRTTPYGSAWNKVKHYNEDVKKAAEGAGTAVINKQVVVDYINSHLG